MSKQDDKRVVKEITRLWWQALLQTKVKLVVSFVGHSLNFITNTVIVPLLIALTIEQIIEGNTSVIGWYALAIIGVSLVAGAIQWLAVWTFNRNGIVGIEYITNRLFANYLDKDYDFFGNNFVGSLGSHISTIKRAFIDYQLIVAFNVPRVLVTLGAMIIVVGFQSPILALVILSSLVLNVAFIFTFSRYRLQFRRQVSEANSDVAAVVGDALSHGTTVKSYASEAHEQSRLHEALAKYSKAQLKSWDLFTPGSFVRNLISMITIAVLLIVSANLYQNGEISIAIIALVQLYVMRMFNTVIDIGEMIKSYDQLMGDAHQPVATMLVESGIKDKKHTKNVKLPVKSVVFTSISYRYPDAKQQLHAIDDLTLNLSKGQRVGVVGYSGSGKSTLTKLLLRFMDVNSGTIEINGVDITDMRQADLRSIISYVPQEPLLFHRSIAENILYAMPDKTHDDMLNAAKLAHVDEFVGNLPDGYDTLVGERGVKLSGGQRQRVAVARAILKDAPILVLDEATSALDSKSEKLIQDALWKLMNDRTAIVIAHRLSTIQRMDTIIVMDAGRIVQSGTHAELLKDTDGIYAKLWSHQSGGYLGDNSTAEASV